MTAILTTLVSFNGSDGGGPRAGLIADAAGDLFGTTAEGGANGHGTVFELVNHGGGAYTPVTLLSFNGANGTNPYSGLIADAAGDLFGTTNSGGADGFGTVFELVNHGGGAYTPVTLLSFNGANGAVSVCRSDRRRRRGPLRHDRIRRDVWQWHGVRAGQPRRRRLHAGHVAQLQWRERAVSVCRSDRRRRRGPLRHDSRGRGERRWHGVRARQPRRRHLHAGHAAQLQRRERDEPVFRSDRRRRRGPLRHDKLGRGVWQWHGVRAGQPRRWRLHAGHVAELQWRERGSIRMPV